MREFDSRYIDGVLDGAGQYQLDVDYIDGIFGDHVNVIVIIPLVPFRVLLV